jgi:hypothetical protein
VAILLAAAVLLPGTHGFEFGRSGGNIRPFTVTISATGVVRTAGAAPKHIAVVSKHQLTVLTGIALAVRFSTIPAVTACPNTLPDVAAQLIRVEGRTVLVHGSCLKRFNRLWTALNRAVTNK